jgi:YVTN family beta-propeller protein/autotransporter-associated beta strand protein
MDTSNRIGAALAATALILASPSAALAQVKSYAFVPSFLDNTVTVVDTTGHSVVGTTVVPVNAAVSASASPDGRRVYITDDGGNSLIVLDVATRAVIGPPIPVGAGTWAATFSKDGRTAYVSSQGDNRVTVIDVASSTVSGPPIVLPVSSAPRKIALTPDGLRAYVSSNDGVYPIDLTTRTVGAVIPVGGMAGTIAITSDGQTAFVTVLGVSHVRLIDLATNTVLPGPIATGLNPMGLTFTPDEQFAYVANGASNTVSVIDVASRTVVKTVNVGPIPLGIAFTPDGRYAYVPSRGGTSVTVIEVAADHSALGNTIPVGSAPFAHGGAFITPNIIVSGAGPLTIANDAALDAAHFRSFVPFHGGMLRLTGDVTTTRHLSLLIGGGTIDTNGFSAVVEGDVINDGTLTKIAEGTLTLSGTSTHAGGTTLAAGTLVVNGTHVAAPLYVASGTLRGSGSLGNLTMGSGVLAPGSAAPGAPTAILHAAQVTMAEGVSFVVDLYSAVAGTGYDRLDVSGVAAIDGATLKVAPSFLPSTGTTFTILTNATGTFAGLSEGAVVAADGRRYRISYAGGDGNDVTLTVVNQAPTISTLAPQTVTENTPLEALAFMVGDTDDDPATLTVTATSSDQAIVTDANITLGGSDSGNGASRTIAIAPNVAARGDTTITLTVSDGADSTATVFTLSVVQGTYYLAEGATGNFFDTDILLANPNAAAAPVTITFLRPDSVPIVLARTLQPMSRMTIRADDVEDLEATAFSTAVVSTDALPLVVERTMRWDATGYGAHTEKATAGAAPAWYFAEGAQGFFSSYFLLANPQPTANTAHVTYFRENAPAIVRDYPLDPGSRKTIGAADDDDLRDRSFGARIRFDLPGVAERAMYFGADPLWLGGHASAGATAPSASWFLAEGATGDYFTTFVLLANPNDDPADVTLTFLPDTGVPVTRSYRIPGGQRLTRNIAFEDVSLANAAVATRVESTRPITVERAQYWGQPGWIEAHNSFGVTAAGLRWGLAEGRVGGADSAQTYILLANPGTDAATVTITFLRTDGTPVVKSFDVPATSRFNVAVVPGAASMVPELAGESFGARIESTRPIVVERSLYTDANGFTWAAGTNATASRLP